MKKVLLTLALAFVGIFSANAQLWMGGSANAAINKNSTGIAISPEIGYSFKGVPFTIAIGANYGVQGTKHHNSYDFNHSLILSPYVRYSVCKIEKFALFLDLTGDLDVLSDDFGYRVGLQPGIAWMATQHWTAAFRWGFIGYNDCDYYNEMGYIDGFNLKFATAAPSFGLYYNF
jgi:hypothetical protein